MTKSIPKIGLKGLLTFAVYVAIAWLSQFLLGSIVSSWPQYQIEIDRIKASANAGTVATIIGAFFGALISIKFRFGSTGRWLLVIVIAIISLAVWANVIQLFRLK